MKTQHQDPAIAELVSDTTARRFEAAYSNLLVAFEVGSVYSAIANLFRLEGVPQGDDFTVPNLLAATEKSFITLLQRGALDRFVKLSPLPEAAQIELDAMSAKVAGQPLPAAEPETDDQADAITKCAADFRAFGADAFKRRWMNDPTNRQVYEQAISAGRI